MYYDTGKLTGRGGKTLNKYKGYGFRKPSDRKHTYSTQADGRPHPARGYYMPMPRIGHL